MPTAAQPADRPLLRDDYPRPLRTVAGFVLHIDTVTARIRAHAALLDAGTLALLDRQHAQLPLAGTSMTGEAMQALELAALRLALQALRQPPDLALVAGHGIAHPRRLGLASRFGIACGLPSIGVADAASIGSARLALHDMRGAFTPLREGSEQIGWLLRSRAGCPPLVVSPGHRVAMAGAAQLVMACVAGDRLPEPLLLAEAQASQHPSTRAETGAGCQPPAATGGINPGPED